MADLSRDLLEQAEHLVAKDSGKPKQANVRRGISTAYYALFHFLSERATAELVGTTNDRADIRAWLGRALEHGTMNDVCKFFGNPTDKAFVSFSEQLNFIPSADLKYIADTFVRLQEARHRADYDLSKKVTRSDAQTAIADVRAAIAKWGHLEKSSPRLTQIFSAGLFRGKKRM